MYNERDKNEKRIKRFESAGQVSKRVKQIHHKADAIKRSEEVGIRFMNAWEEKIIEQQKAEERKAKEIAKVLKERSVPMEDIIESTGLTAEEVEKL